MGFQKGVSGNPGGRPKEIVEVEKRCRKNSLEWVERLENIARNPKAPLRVQIIAMDLLLQRGLGKVPETLTLRHDETPQRDWSDEELVAFLNSRADARRTGGAVAAGPSDDPPTLN